VTNQLNADTPSVDENFALYPVQVTHVSSGFTEVYKIPDV